MSTLQTGNLCVYLAAVIRLVNDEAVEGREEIHSFHAGKPTNLIWIIISHGQARSSEATGMSFNF